MFARTFSSVFVAAAALAAVTRADAQPLGTFTWQLQPYCNVVTVTVTGTAGVFTLEGYDDQCGGPNRAPATGVATPNPDGTIGIGLNVIAAPGGHGLQVEARISASGLSGPWTDSDGHAGTFAFGTRTGGSPRPAPLVSGPIVPPAIGLRSDGAVIASGAVGTGTVPASGAGTRMMWYPGQAAFRAGTVSGDGWDETQIGRYSAAFGANTKATNEAAFAAGLGAIANGQSAVALGYFTRSDSLGSFAAGIQSIAGGRGSVAIGGVTTPQGGYKGVYAGGEGAFALGSNHDASGPGSFALGTNVTTTANGTGSFVYGDRSSNNQIVSFFPNEFLVRAAGGTTFYSNGALTAGVKLAAGANAWSSLSDVNSKENFRDLDAASLLDAVARMPIREWNYKAQDAAIRHVGPTAQDFRAAFGLGEDPLRISTIDADGIALAAIQALVLRVRVLEQELAALRAANGGAR